MSASSKKKIRKDQSAEKLTEKQLAEQKEAKQLKIYTAIAAVVLAVLVVVALSVGIVRSIENYGVMDKLFPAVTVGDHKLTSVELNYYFLDEIDEFFEENGAYVSYMGLDTSKPLDEQYIAEGVTWSQDFLNSAAETARQTYALVDAANAAGYELSQASIDNIDNTFSQYAMNAFMGGADLSVFLKNLYGERASAETYRAYLMNKALASEYYTKYIADLEYTAEDIAAADAEDPAAYSFYSYNYYYITASKFTTGGTTAEDGTVSYSIEERQAGAEEAKKVAETLYSAAITDEESFDAAIAALEINQDSTSAASTAVSDVKYSSVHSSMREWIGEAGRKVGDIALLPSSTTTTNEDGEEVTLDMGYYVVLVTDINENETNLVNVRHLLVQFEGGSTDDSGNTVYSAEEKAAAKAQAEEYLNTWKQGEATEESFGALANKNSDDGDGTTGGLYENVYPGQMVTNFDSWCFDESRKPGDVEIIETEEYGYHIMYFVSDSDMTYRDYLITQALRSADGQEWYTALLADMTMSAINSDRIDTAVSLTLSSTGTSTSTESTDTPDATDAADATTETEDSETATDAAE